MCVLKCKYQRPIKTGLNLISFLIIACAAFNCNPVSKQKELNRLSGLWQLHIMELQDAETGEWKEWRNGMQGYLLYDNDENMSLHLTLKGYQHTDLQFPNFTDTISIEALKHLTGSYVYIAKYTVYEDDGIIEHARISHSNPAEWHNVVRRKFTFSGDTLVLTPVEKKNAGLRLKWIRF